MGIFHRNESLKEFIKFYPITSLFLLINLLMYVILSIDGGSTNSFTLLKYGAFYQPLVLQGEWYRFITPMFLHIGLHHLIFNCLILYVFGSALEGLIGKVRYFLVYLFSGIGGSVFSFFISPESIAAGASGAIFGVFGVFFYFYRYKPGVLDYTSGKLFISLFVINLIFTFIMPSTSIGGHIGGLVFGFIFSIIFLRR